jgi:hypothetical protein
MACSLRAVPSSGTDNALPPRSCHPDDHADRAEAPRTDPTQARVQRGLILIRVLPPGLFPQDGACDLRERPTAGDRWRPLRTARLRWHVDQTWTRHLPARGGSGAPRVADPWLARETPAGCPRQASPTRAIALLGGALAGSGPGTSPCIDGLSLVTAMVVPPPPVCSNHAHYRGWAWTE